MLYQFWYLYPNNQLNEQGQSINAFNGLKAFTQNLLKNEKPNALAFVFDQRLKHCKRKKIYAAYKSQRKGTPKDLELQFKISQQWLIQQNLPVVSSFEDEADDVIATLVKIYRDQFDKIVFVSSDKDLAQLMQKNDCLWRIQNDQKLYFKDIIKLYKVQPNQIADLLALAGDKSDNIKGVPGVGLSTAAKLLKKWGSIEQVIQHHDEIKNMKFRQATFVHLHFKDYLNQLHINHQLTQLNSNVKGINETDLCHQ